MVADEVKKLVKKTKKKPFYSRFHDSPLFLMRYITVLAYIIHPVIVKKFFIKTVTTYGTYVTHPVIVKKFLIKTVTIYGTYVTHPVIVKNFFLLRQKYNLWLSLIFCSFKDCVSVFWTGFILQEYLCRIGILQSWARIM